MMYHKPHHKPHHKHPPKPGHRSHIGMGAVIHFRADEDLVARVIAIKRKRARAAFHAYDSVQ